MNAVITGDVIKSTKVSAARWLETLKDELSKFGAYPKDWEIYRGDSFQLFVEDAAQTLIRAIQLKAALKATGADIRIAIGLGDKSYDAERITESNGSAFVNSGEKFELLKKEKQNMAIKSDFAQFDTEMNVYLKLGLIAMDNWTISSAEVVKLMLENPSLTQREIGELIGIKQNAVSKRLKTAHFFELMEMNEIYKIKLKSIL